MDHGYDKAIPGRRFIIDAKMDTDEGDAALMGADGVYLDFTSYINK
jgi:hypothetical protein